MTDAPSNSLDGMAVGFIGLGLMGRPMARNLLDAGARLVVHNRSPLARDCLGDWGEDRLTWAESPAEVADAVDMLVIMVADTTAVEAVLFGENGIGSLHDRGALSGKVIIDMGTTDVLATREFARELAARGAAFVDAPVSGGTGGAERAALAIMVGGADEAVERARPLFEVLGAKTVHVGDSGAGQIAKTANQIIVGVTIEAVAEGLALARRAGVDPARVRDAMRGGFADSNILQIHGRRMIEGDFAPGGKVATHHKDLSQAHDFAASMDMNLPAADLTRARFADLMRAGKEGLDHSALYLLLANDDDGKDDDAD